MQIETLSRILILLLALSIPTAGTYGKEKTTSGERVYGWVEKAIVMPVGAKVKIKLDTGALTSSMHAENIEIYSIGGGEDGVRFTLELEDKETGKLVKRKMDLDVERYLVVRGAGGEDRRPVVKLELCIGNKVFKEQFSLRDRGNMNYPVLIGRRMLQELGLVDSKATFLTEPECKVEEAILEGKASGMYSG
jgi:hypothetical protein